MGRSPRSCIVAVRFLIDGSCASREEFAPADCMRAGMPIFGALLIFRQFGMNFWLIRPRRRTHAGIVCEGRKWFRPQPLSSALHNRNESELS
jgi:hypothetical protein